MIKQKGNKQEQVGSQEAKLFKRGGADVPLFETIKTNAGTQPKNALEH